MRREFVMAKVIALGAAQPARDHPDPELRGGAWGAMSEALWPAWNGMPDAEARVLDSFGDMLGEKLLVLWALSRFGDGSPADGTLAELVDESGRPTFGDWLAEDMLFAAFALGVAWATEGEAPAEAPAPPRALPLPHQRVSRPAI
jgi:hypothetical protein